MIYVYVFKKKEKKNESLGKKLYTGRLKITTEFILNGKKRRDDDNNNNSIEDRYERGKKMSGKGEEGGKGRRITKKKRSRRKL